MELTAENVEQLYEDCRRPLEIEESPMDLMLEVEGIVHMSVFNKKALEEKRSDIESMLSQLPEGFHEATGGGWSFLNACNRADGVQWTGLHLTMEKLMTMGIGLGVVSYVLPREMWPSLPGGMPYFVVKQQAGERV